MAVFPSVGCCGVGDVGGVTLESSHDRARQAAGWWLLGCVGIHADVVIHKLVMAVQR
jgi:hypothetical protein